MILFPFVSFAQTSNQVCSSIGYTIAAINGVLTNEAGARKNRDNLKALLDDTYNNQPLTVDFLLNPSHLAGIGDGIMAIYQKFFESETVSDYDLTNMLIDASAKVKTQKLLLVAHSQGNFYANSFYDTVVDKVGGVPASSIGVYGVANPANRVAGNGLYLTSETDHVIAGLAEAFPFRTIKKPNTRIEETAGGFDPLSGHSFSGVYLKYRSTEIVSGIKASLSKLSINPERREDAPCIYPPKLTIAYKITGATLYVADPTIKLAIIMVSAPVKSIAQNMVIAPSVGVYNFVIATAKKVAYLAVKVVASVSSVTKTLVNNVGNLVIRNQGASVILATSQVPQSNVKVSNQVVAVIVPQNIAPVILKKKEQVALILPTAPVIETSLILAKKSTPIVVSQAITLNNIQPDSLGGGGGPSPAQVLGSIQASTPELDATTTPITATSTPADIIAPTITILGLSPATTTVGTIYIDLGATAFDDVDGVLPITATSTVDITTIGAYTVTYTAIDLSNNIATSTRTINVIPPEGKQINFDAGNAITYSGNFMVCNMDSKSVISNGNNVGMSYAINSLNPRASTAFNTNFRFIFGEYGQATLDCINGTYFSNHSNSFYYTAGTVDAIVYDAQSASAIVTFGFASIVPNVVGLIDNPPRTVTLVVPSDADITALAPVVTVSTGASVSPASEAVQNFTLPVEYTVTALDGSTQVYTVSVLLKGNQFNFDTNNLVAYYGNFMICNMDSKAIISNGNNAGVTSSLGSLPPVNTALNTNFRYIFGGYGQSVLDCRNNTYVNDYSNSFYYPNSSGVSVVYSSYVTPVLSSSKAISDFSFSGFTPEVSGTIDEVAHTVALTVPFGTGLTTIIPTISVSVGATSSPASGVLQDFTNPVEYFITAEDGSTQIYTVTATTAPAPTITSYTFNGSEGDITLNATTTPVVLVMNASKNVNWTSIKIGVPSTPNTYKIFKKGAGCEDGTATCTKIWNVNLSQKGIAIVDGVYRIKVHMEDATGNDFNEYLAPYVITVALPQ